MFVMNNYFALCNVISVAPIPDINRTFDQRTRGSRFANKLPTISEINVCPRTKRFVRLIAKSRLVITDTQSEAREVDLRYFCVL